MRLDTVKYTPLRIELIKAITHPNIRPIIAPNSNKIGVFGDECSIGATAY